MTVHCVWEHNGPDTLLYAIECPGAFARGACLEDALAKLPEDVMNWLRWAGRDVPPSVSVVIAEEKASALAICDADSDVLFAAEREPLTLAEYQTLKQLALRSAEDFETLYRSIPDVSRSVLAVRSTFYGQRPRTAQEMYCHTRSVNAYYFGEIGVEADNDGSIAECRARGFAALEKQPGFLKNKVITGSYGEEWCLRKMLRRFLWHDRIHARAMRRMAARTFPDYRLPENLKNFSFCDII